MYYSFDIFNMSVPTKISVVNDKTRQRSVTAVYAQGTRGARTVITRCTQWKRHKSAGYRQLEHRRNAMELRRNAKVAVRTP